MAIHNIDDKELAYLYDNVDVKVEVAKESLFHFMAFYLVDNYELEPADFHPDIIEALDSVDQVDKFLSIMGFRGCAKSTILEGYALWSMLNGKHTYIIWLGNTMDDSKEALANIKAEIEENEELRSDFGIVLADEGKAAAGKNSIITKKWSEKQLIINDCTIIAKSRMGKVRGKKFKKERIDLIICDDIEDIAVADTAEKREATRRWFYADVLQATKQGTLGTETKVVMLYNLVNKNCLGVHFSMSDNVKDMRFPLLDENGDVTWDALYPDMAAIEAKKKEVMMAGVGLGHIIWAREFLLKDVDEEDAVLKRNQIQYYPDEWLQKKFLASGVGVDFAISKKRTADYTAMVKLVDVKNEEGERVTLVMKNPLKKRMGFEETIAAAMQIEDIMPRGNRWYPEKVSYQQAAIEVMEKSGLNVHPQKATADKRARIVSACFYVQTGRVLFPKDGAEELIENIVGFGIEDHDDLADAFAYAVLAMVKRKSGLLVG